MNAPETQPRFVPKQALAPTPDLYNELVADCMENLAEASLNLLGPFPNGSIIHDNGCGTGAGTTAILAAAAAVGADDISITGTDINDSALSIYRKRATVEGWPADAVHADATKLDCFGEATCTHSLSNALLFVLPDNDDDNDAGTAVATIREAYRTLQPGGVAVFNSWKYLPNMSAIAAASQETRPEGTPVPRAGKDKWSSAEFLRGVVEKGGFVSEQVTMHEAPVSVTTAALDRYANMLWSFIGGTTTAGWLESSDEENWDRAIEIIKQELRKTEGARIRICSQYKICFMVLRV
ncbi:hypothetical protein PG984_005637 [Apiospora sp. TS-2023a]